MSNEMDISAIQQKMGEVGVAAQTAISAASTALDATVQTRLRQDHIGELREIYQNKVESVNPQQVAIDLSAIETRCPSSNLVVANAKGFQDACRIYRLAVEELYEMTEKMRSHHAALASDPGEAAEPF